MAEGDTAVRLSDEELAVVMTAASPLDPGQRGVFLELVAAALRPHEVLGPGLVARVCRGVLAEVRWNAR